MQQAGFSLRWRTGRCDHGASSSHHVSPKPCTTRLGPSAGVLLQSGAPAAARSSGRADLQRRAPQPRTSRWQPMAASAVTAAGGPDDTNPAAPAASDSPAPPRGLSSLAKRAIFGTILGVGGGVVIVLGEWLYAAVTCLVAYQCSKEFLGLVNAKGISAGMQPPPAAIAPVISLLCVALNVWAFISSGKTSSALAIASFIVLSLQLVASEKPRFSQLTSSVFGLLYCGYLPSFWIKLRWLAIPASNSSVVQQWVTGLGGVTQATVGLVATFTAVACIIAADTGAFFCGKALGRTQLSSISPKKTVEGAIGGLLCSVLVAVGCCRFFLWPDSMLSAALLGTIIFFSSLFGDLIESVIKRDAGLKDASNLIPGHGGLLDRMDSYLFTGACVYFFTRFVLGGYGV